MLALVNVNGNLTNALTGAGTLSIDPTDITLSGDNSKFTGLFTIDDAESTLRVANKNNLGQASIRNAGTLAINTNDDWTLSNSVTGTGM
ncbi:hypothetical protein [Yersinia ruckeri]|uniref:hypothetical protein n=1 Tax=Yersinia ruckeri TaxID=29486 RepID=UPI001F374183|nr:hypothetical protein [Yersinia ruckeri]UIN02589.1 hypothetical protein LGL91_17675 [Yersinia ruckeri]